MVQLVRIHGLFIPANNLKSHSSFEGPHTSFRFQIKYRTFYFNCISKSLPFPAMSLSLKDVLSLLIISGISWNYLWMPFLFSKSKNISSKIQKTLIFILSSTTNYTYIFCSLSLYGFICENKYKIQIIPY